MPNVYTKEELAAEEVDGLKYNDEDLESDGNLVIFMPNTTSGGAFHHFTAEEYMLIVIVHANDDSLINTLVLFPWLLRWRI